MIVFHFKIDNLMRNDNKILNFGKIESLVDLQNLYTNNTIYDSFKKKYHI